jgi:aryl-alcohol dehydrogenase-like predicted oxidoreductase
MVPTTVKLGDVEIARIGLGTNRLTNTPTNVAFIREAVTAGVGMIDTAHSYTGGGSEATIGTALTAVPATCVVATKGGIGGPGRGRPENLKAEIEESFRRLRTDTIALY